MQRLFILLYFYGMKYILFVFLAGWLLAACNNPSSETTTTAATPPKDSTPPPQDFFPVPDYIGGQVKMIDSLKLPISKTVTISGKPVLSVATDAELRSFSQLFREPDISSPALKSKYTQTSIADQSVPSVTLIFSANDTAQVIQKINVYIQPDPVQNDKVTGVYMEKHFISNDTIVNQKLYWKTDKNMQVNTEKQVKGKTLPVEQVKITWGY